ncbi:cryptochrome/deoxyribodipyrimidine photo-lyase family protein [Reichenbachiella versicolor]|uniref:cryptochrome/deoxyribodipyrimidine photo-lyase family protein n=1 Tax=Reichenbachiella versicolor TaxID=1821036 RepID=UPI000D6E7505|nr:FAD-binding domain-containing protein [Reichenbachiella versicolor]
MTKQTLDIVWLKRDIRLDDHAPLYNAELSSNPYLIIYIFETSIISHPDTSDRHLQFVYHSLLDMDNQLKYYNRSTTKFYAEAIEVFGYFEEHYQIGTVYSHEENGIQKTWQRDLEISRFFRKHGIVWKEYQRDGVIRGVKNRDGWDKNWYITMNQPIIENSFSKSSIAFSNPFPLPKNFLLRVQKYPKSFQPAGSTNAWKYLKSFCEKRGHFYHIHISKPRQSRESCGRISPYLAWGNLSIRQAYQFIKSHPNLESHKGARRGILTRLKWHCHFIQKFEVECAYEYRCINKGYELLQRDNSPDKLNAWKEGMTGYPMVDACMRAVKQTGWINFRMRAMLVSFLCHHLDQDWKNGVYHLAQLFLDYEPGIHYPQFQMQAGTTGINTVRIYNPVKQSIDHDTDGSFLLKWLPELQKIPVQYIHEPWKMTSIEQELYDFRISHDYPAPIVDLKESGKAARDKIWGHRKHPLVKQEQQRILRTHTRRQKTTD